MSTDQIQKIRPSKQPAYRKAYMREWYMKNRTSHMKKVVDYQQTQRYTMVDCGCGSSVTLNGLSQHKNTKKHKRWLIVDELNKWSIKEEAEPTLREEPEPDPEEKQ